MKSFLHTLNAIFVSIGQTRAAAAMARNGMYAEAKAIMLAE